MKKINSEIEKFDEVKKEQIQEDWKSNISVVKDRLVEIKKNLNKENNNCTLPTRSVFLTLIIMIFMNARNI